MFTTMEEVVGVNNCFSVYHTSWITGGPKSNFICENIATKAILCFFCCSEVNSTWLITSELANQRARKVLFTCVVYTNRIWYVINPCPKENINIAKCYLLIGCYYHLVTRISLIRYRSLWRGSRRSDANFRGRWYLAYGRLNKPRCSYLEVSSWRKKCALSQCTQKCFHQKAWWLHLSTRISLSESLRWCFSHAN